MKDGLYQVTTPYLCAGFVIEDGKVTDCAPILKKRMAHWKTVALKIADLVTSHSRPEGKLTDGQQNTIQGRPFQD